MQLSLLSNGLSSPRSTALARDWTAFCRTLNTMIEGAVEETKVLRDDFARHGATSRGDRRVAEALRRLQELAAKKKELMELHADLRAAL